MTWETVIGLEVHIQLRTQSKLFSGAATHYGAAPNTQACLVDVALPGTLPVLNREAIIMALQFGLAIHAKIATRCVFARKNYFYPDLPKGYQISQLDEPIVGEGQLLIPDEQGQKKAITIVRAHLEEDAGKSLHDLLPGISGIDLNRAGTPLLEIVSAPELQSGPEAVRYLKTLHGLVRCLGICDGNLQEGSFRCDVNVSVRKQGSDVLGTRAELKNLNSFRFVEKAIAVETARQIALIESGQSVIQETRLFDPDKNETRSLRSKENANDYRYFSDPDLLPINIDKNWVEEARARLPELPEAKQFRYENTLKLSPYDAHYAVSDPDIAQYFEALLAAGVSPKLAINWMMGDLAASLNAHQLSLSESPLTSQQLADLLRILEAGTISSKIAKTVFEHLWQEGGTAEKIIEKYGLIQITDSATIDNAVTQVLQQFPEQLAAYRSGKQALFGFFVGQAMKLLGGKANPQQVNDCLRKQLG